MARKCERTERMMREQRKDMDERYTAYLEIFRNLDEEGMSYNCHLDDILEREIKCVTA